MRIDPRALIGPLAAMLLLALTLQQTLDALRRTGTWGADARRRGGTRTASPFERIETELARRDGESVPLPTRNPFAYAPKPAPEQPANRHRRPRPAPATPKPVLTAIIFDNDPRALVQFDGRNYTVHANSLFADFRVVRITRDEVVLDKNGESLVLKRPVGGS